MQVHSQILCVCLSLSMLLYHAEGAAYATCLVCPYGTTTVSAGANNKATCVPMYVPETPPPTFSWAETVAIEISFSIDIPTETITPEIQSTIKSSIALAFGVDVNYVRIISINGVPVEQRRRLLSTTNDIQVAVGGFESTLQAKSAVETVTSNNTIATSISSQDPTLVVGTIQTTVKVHTSCTNSRQVWDPSVGQCICVEGYLWNEGYCDICKDGFYMNVEQFICQPCPPGSTSAPNTVGIGACESNCAIDYFWDPTSFTCVACPQHSHAPAMSTHLESCECDSGRILLNGTCDTCNASYFENEDSDCEACPLHTISPVGSVGIENCVCQENFYYSSFSFACLPCEKGYYKPTGNNETCFIMMSTAYTLHVVRLYECLVYVACVLSVLYIYP